MQVAIDSHHARNPVQRSREVHDAGHEPEHEGAAQRRDDRGQVSGARETEICPRTRHQRDEQRRQRNPRERRMAEGGKTEGEKNAGRGGEREIERTRQRVTQGLSCSSFFSFAATDSASRRLGNFPMRTR